MTAINRVSAILVSSALVFAPIMPASAATQSIAVPAIATTQIMPADVTWSPGSEVTNYDRRYRRHRRHHRRHKRIGAGGIIAGILVLGGIAAIASSASKKNKRDRDYDTRNDRYEDNDYRDDRRRSRANGGGIDSAVNACSNAAERAAGRNARVEQIQSITKEGNGWRVEGDLSGANERSFSCGATNGQVDFVQLGTGRLSYNN